MSLAAQINQDFLTAFKSKQATTVSVLRMLKAALTNKEIEKKLGKTEKEQIHVGEYACMDDEKILCRMDIKNCDETKVAKETKQFILYAQGNEKTPEAYVQKNLIAACDYIQQFCEGKYTIIQTIYS